MKRKDIDNGRVFDWSKASADYALYRDIYPQSLYERLHLFGIAKENTRHLDIGTGTGVIPIHLHRFGAGLTGVDISDSQIESARKWSLELGSDIEWRELIAKLGLRACRGVGPSLEEDRVRAFSKEHMSMLVNDNVPNEFRIPHQIVMYVYRVV